MVIEAKGDCLAAVQGEVGYQSWYGVNKGDRFPVVEKARGFYLALTASRTCIKMKTSMSKVVRV